MKNKVFILIALINLICQSILAQKFDLLKDYIPGQSIIYTFNRDASPTWFFQDTNSVITIFTGTYRVYIDSITILSTDSIRLFQLRIQKKGDEVVRNPLRIISTKDVDTFYNRTITEYMKVNFHTALSKIEGWFFPDTVFQSPRCPMDTTIFYPYSNYYRYYYFPSPDTFDVRSDSLILTNLTTDCLDVGFTRKFIITTDEGTVKCINSLYNFFDWSYTDTYTKEAVSEVRLIEKQPVEYYLSQNYPNPFNPSTVIGYQLSVISHVSLRVYDILGREVATLVNEEKPAGEYEVEFNAAANLRFALTSGVYFYQLKAGSFIQTKKMLLLR